MLVDMGTGALTEQERAVREQVRLQAADLFSQGRLNKVAIEDMPPASRLPAETC